VTREKISTAVVRKATQVGVIADIVTDDIQNDGLSALHLVMTLANKLGLANVTPVVQGKKATGEYYDLWVASAAVAANGTTIYQITPLAAVTATQVTESKVLILPDVFRVVLRFGGTTGAGNSYDVTLAGAVVPV